MMTLDFNLNKAAKIQGIKVMNLNELVEALKSKVIPGQELELELLSLGKEENQAVGYLSDGTMVIVDGASDKLGQMVKVKVSKLIQKDSGKIIFSKLV